MHVYIICRMHVYIICRMHAYIIPQRNRGKSLKDAVVS